MAKYGSPLSLDDKLKVDLIVVGSSAVDRNGARLGKGEVKENGKWTDRAISQCIMLSKPSGCEPNPMIDNAPCFYLHLGVCGARVWDAPLDGSS